MSSIKTAGRSLNLAILGTRGIPANYGGFETFAEELSRRLVKRGHRVTVYGRSHYVEAGLREYLGVRLRVFPSIRTKYLDTVAHGALSALDSVFRRYDAVLFCNAANAAFTWLPRLSGAASLLNVDGIERQRSKWSRIGKAYYALSERLALWLPTQIVSDAQVIHDYYLERYGRETPCIPYGASTETSIESDILDRWDLRPGRYLLFVSRLEPENNAHLVLEAYKRSGVTDRPLVIVGDAPYSRRYIDSLRAAAAGSSVVMPGAVYGRGYRQLLSHCRCYFQATQVGGTHPALIEAMGVGALVLANDTPENREVVGEAGLLLPFSDVDGLSRMIARVCSSPSDYEDLREAARARIGRLYDWEDIVDRYEELFERVLSRSGPRRGK